MAPRRDLGQVLRRPYGRNTNAAASMGGGKQSHPLQKNKISEDDGDVMMGGYRIPTIISSKGAIQHKLDRYAPGEASRGEGHKRTGGCWDGFGHQWNRNTLSVLAEDREGGEGSRKDYPIIIEDSHQNYDKDTRQDRRAKVYHHAVASSRLRYEKDGYASRNQRSDRYSNGSYSNSWYTSKLTREHSNHQYTNGYGQDYSDPRNSNRENSQYSPHLRNDGDNFHNSSYSRRNINPPHSNIFGSRHRGAPRSDRYYAPGYLQDNARHCYDDERTRSNNSRLHKDNRQQQGQNSDLNPGGTFEGAMRGLVSHAAKFLKNAHWRDRETIQAAVWKAYGDSIASLGNRNSNWQVDNRQREWVSAKDIPSLKDGDPLAEAIRSANAILGSNTGYTDSRHQRSAASAALRRGIALDSYQKANTDYEKTLDDLFGSGRPSHVNPYAASKHALHQEENTSFVDSNTRSYTDSHNRSGGSESGSVRGRPASSGIPVRRRSRSPSRDSDCTITGVRSRHEVPRPKPAKESPIPVYTSNPSDPTKFLNVPRPRVRQQWNIPADYYNGEAWADHRKSELETGAIPSFYPDRWFSGQSFGDKKKDEESKARAAKNLHKTQEPIGRECYSKDPVPGPLTQLARSRSIASELGRGFGAICLDSGPPSVCEGSRAASELPDDFDIYGPVIPLVSYEAAHSSAVEKLSGQLQAVKGVPEQQVIPFNYNIRDGGDDSSRTPTQSLPPPNTLCSNGGSATPKILANFTLASAMSPTPRNEFSNSNTLCDSRKSTPTLYQVSPIEYSPSASNSLVLRSESSLNTLIDLANSVPTSPNVTRSGEAYPGYYTGLALIPVHKHEDIVGKRSTWNGLLGNSALDDDEQNLPVLIPADHLPLSGDGDRSNLLLITEEIAQGKPSQYAKEEIPEDFLGPNTPKATSSTEEADDRNYLGLDWFLK